MNCPLCGTENNAQALKCKLCETELHEYADSVPTDHTVLDIEDISRMSLIWPRVAIFVALVTLTALPWFFMADLFRVPADVQASIDKWDASVERYTAERDGWIGRKNQILGRMQAHYWDQNLSKEAERFSDLPLEIFMAYLEDDLDIPIATDDTFTLYPYGDLEERSFLLTKTDSMLWPFRIKLALEIDLVQEKRGVGMKFSALRRGERSVDPGLAHVLFSEELTQLAPLSGLAGGIYNLVILPPPEDVGESGLALSIDYQHRSFQDVPN